MNKSGYSGKPDNKYIADLFINYINQNYQKATKQFTGMLRAIKLEFNEEHFHASILKTYNKIERTGFDFNKYGGMSNSGYSFMSYMGMVIKNETLGELRGGPIKYDLEIDVECNDILGGSDNNNHAGSRMHLDDRWLYNQEDHLESLERHLIDETLSNRIMKYVQRKYSIKECSLFKFYFLNKLAGIKISYSAIAESIGVKKTSKTDVWNIVTKIKEDVIIKFKLKRIK